MRKIIQITNAATADNDEGEASEFLYALCDDGTVWEYWHWKGEWKQIPGLPNGSTEQVTK